jgi:hypothetical protein
MGGNGRVRGIVLQRAPSGASDRADAWSGDVGDLRGHNWGMASNDCECPGIFGSGVDGRAEEFRYASVMNLKT